jgi:hypothetical protein
VPANSLILYRGLFSSAALLSFLIVFGAVTVVFAIGRG